MVAEEYITTWMNIAGPFLSLSDSDIYDNSSVYPQRGMTHGWILLAYLFYHRVKYLWQFKRIPTAWDYTWMNTAGLSFLSLSKLSMTIQAYTHSVRSHMDEHC